MLGEFAFADLNGYQAAPPLNNYHDGAANFQPLQSHGSIYPSPAQAQQGQHPQPAPDAQGSKRKADADSASDSHHLNLEEASRVAAEEDKRRRNTAASARFRVKKKQREQALEKSAKEASDKIGQLESRVSQLQTENKWLKNLLVEKNEGHGEDITALWKEFTKHASKRTLEAKEAVKADR